jgi:uncharacterized membrane protein YdjX (TVP38/TMEM64 family)
LVDLIRDLSVPSFWGFVDLTALFVLGALIFVPRTLMCVAAGIVFGFWAVPFSILGSTIGAILGFFFVRYFFRAPFERATLSRPRWRALLQAVDEDGWRIVGLLRLGAPVPGTVQNCLFALTRVRFWPYVVATAIGIAPQTILFVYLGSFAKMTLSDPAQLGNIITMLAGAVVMLIVVLRVTSKAKARLAAASAAARPLIAPASGQQDALHLAAEYKPAAAHLETRQL